jgi:DNA-binding HxlR family transcriptional regulator
MPDFIKDNHVYHNPVEFALKKIGGSYKMPILWRLQEKNWRFSEFQKNMPHISDRMLSKALNELISDGFIEKKVNGKIPAQTEYAISKRGLKSIKVIIVLRKYGAELMKEENITVSI